MERTETSQDVTKHEATNDVVKAASGASIEYRAKRTERNKFHSNPKALSTNVGATPTNNPRHILKCAQHLFENIEYLLSILLMFVSYSNLIANAIHCVGACTQVHAFQCDNLLCDAIACTMHNAISTTADFIE
jgi:hypothetical protein